jgi:hypothetical protein
LKNLSSNNVKLTLDFIASWDLQGQHENEKQANYMKLLTGLTQVVKIAIKSNEKALSP